ncbi:MAG: nuclear transport factor 2 family protein [Chitinophagales bacterium]
MEKDSSQTSAIKDMLIRYYADMSQRDWKKYRSYFWDSETIATVWQKPGDKTEKVNIITVDEFIRQTPNGPDSKTIFGENMTSYKIKMEGSLAAVWTEYKARFGAKESLMEWKGKDLFSLMRHRNQWKIVSLSFARN